MREDKRRDPDDQKQTQLVPGEKCNEKTRHQEQGESADQKHATNKSPLLPDRGEDVVVMHSCSGKEPKLDLRVRRLESFSSPTARANRDQ